MVELLRLEQSLFRMLVSVEVYLPSVVLIGGWIPHLYKRFGGFPIWDGPLSLTSELDVLVPAELPPSGRRTLPKILRDAAFEPVGDASPYAVWANDPDVGEKVEFLVLNSGPARREGTVLPVQSQPELGAIALDPLWILVRHTDTIVVPREAFQTAGIPCHSDITCVVPTLGAYILNKGATFFKRPTGDDRKRYKDLLYIRDLMAGGSDVVGHLRTEIREIAHVDRRSELYVETARNSVALALQEKSRQDIREAGAMLAEREEKSSAAAEADMGGYLTDFKEMIDDLL